jgi:general secretion pathway protein G
MKSQTYKRGGFTIIEVIVIVVIIGVIAAVITPRLLGRIGQAKRAAAESTASGLADALGLFIADHGEIERGAPIDILWEKPSSIDEADWEPYVGKEADLLDPWKQKFKLVVPGEVNRFGFDVVSYGSDGQPGGEGDAKDIVKP